MKTQILSRLSLDELEQERIEVSLWEESAEKDMYLEKIENRISKVAFNI